jgi:hypothetical protein
MCEPWHCCSQCVRLLVKECHQAQTMLFWYNSDCTENEKTKREIQIRRRRARWSHKPPFVFQMWKEGQKEQKKQLKIKALEELLLIHKTEYCTHARGLLRYWLLFLFGLVFGLKMEAMYSTKTFENLPMVTLRHISEVDFTVNYSLCLVSWRTCAFKS